MIAAQHLAKARRALASASLLLRDGDNDGACNRAYYAMFDAAIAALFAVQPDLGPEHLRTHNGLIAAVGQYLVKPGSMEASMGRAINQVERIRLLADYTGEPVDTTKVAWAILQAEQFVAAADATIGAQSHLGPIGEPDL